MPCAEGIWAIIYYPTENKKCHTLRAMAKNCHIQNFSYIIIKWSRAKKKFNMVLRFHQQNWSCKEQLFTLNKLIGSIMDKRSLVVVAPPGSGKSLPFLVSAYVLKKVIFVCAPWKQFASFRWRSRLQEVSHAVSSRTFKTISALLTGGASKFGWGQFLCWDTM